MNVVREEEHETALEKSFLEEEKFDEEAESQPWLSANSFSQRGHDKENSRRVRRKESWSRARGSTGSLQTVNNPQNTQVATINPKSEKAARLRSRTREKRGSWKKGGSQGGACTSDQIVLRVNALCTKMNARMEKHAGRERNVIQFYKETVRKQQDELKALQH